MANNFFDSYYKKINDTLGQASTESLTLIAEALIRARENSKKIIIVGNGGSAAMASHVSVDLTKAAGIRAVNFNEADLITCFANDYGYENWVSEALKAYADNGDIIVLISSSGRSNNIINAAKYAKEKGLFVITLSGFMANNPLRQIGNVNLWVESSEYNIIEMVHHIWLLAAVDYVISKHLT